MVFVFLTLHSRRIKRSTVLWQLGANGYSGIVYLTYSLLGFLGANKNCRDPRTYMFHVILVVRSQHPRWGSTSDSLLDFLCNYWINAWILSTTPFLDLYWDVLQVGRINGINHPDKSRLDTSGK